MTNMSDLERQAREAERAYNDHRFRCFLCNNDKECNSEKTAYDAMIGAADAVRAAQSAAEVHDTYPDAEDPIGPWTGIADADYI